MWVKTLAKFAADDSIEGVEPKMEWEIFYFNTEKVIAWNKSNSGGACIWLEAGGSITIALTMSHMDKVMETEKEDLLSDAKYLFEYKEQ